MANRPLDTALLDRAIEFAVKAHAGTERRGKGFPYIVHPLEAVEIVATMTSDQELLAAAALHDTVEDTEVTVDQLRGEFGDRVASLVEAESDKFVNGVSEEASWHDRKKAAIERLAAAPHDAKTVALGDKLSNMRAIWRDYSEKGDELWKIFHTSDKKEHEWHYRGLVASLSELSDTFAYKEFASLVDKVFGEECGSLTPELINLDDYEQSGDGYTAISYNNRDGRSMMKLYSDYIDKDVPQTEYLTARKVAALGLRVPKALRLVTDGKRLGVEFERIHDKESFARAISNHPNWIEYISVRFAKLCRLLHSTPCDTSFFGDAKGFYTGQVDKATFLTPSQKENAMKIINGSSDATTCLHGDLHIGNIITNGIEDFWIDLADFRHGDPMFDIGMVYFVTQTCPEDLTKKLYHIDNAQMDTVWHYFSRVYFDTEDEKVLEEKSALALRYAALIAIHFANREQLWGPLADLINRVL